MLSIIFTGTQAPLEIAQTLVNKAIERSRRAFRRLSDGRSSERLFSPRKRIKAPGRYNRPILTGQTIGHYKILEKLGSGGMGDVWKAEDTKLHRDVALKLLASHLLRDEEARKRFHREAQAAASLNHPNVTTIHEIDEADGKTFLV